jgi:hypothetical protein
MAAKSRFIFAAPLAFSAYPVNILERSLPERGKIRFPKKWPSKLSGINHIIWT